MPSSLTISFTPASPTPANGYRVKYWPTGSPGSVVLVSPNPTSSPVSITGLTGLDYSGTIEAACSGGQYSTPVSFSASTSPVAYIISSGAYGNPGVCSGTTSVPVYADPGNNVPIVGLTLYTTYNSATFLGDNSSTAWFLLEKGGVKWKIQIGTDGVISNYDGTCP